MDKKIVSKDDFKKYFCLKSKIYYFYNLDI